MLSQGLGAVLVAGALLWLAHLGELPLLGGVVAIQLLAAVGFVVLVDAPATRGTFVLALAAGAGADAVIVVGDGNVGGLSGVVALALVGSLLHQLSRRQRSRVTESLADTFFVVVIVSAAACLVAALEQAALHPHDWPIRAALAAAGVTLLAARLGDAIARRPLLGVGATRGWPGLLLGLGAGVATSLLIAAGQVGAGSAALLGLAVTGTVTAVDLAVDLAATELTAGARNERRVAALRPLRLALPFAALGPVLLLAVRLLD